MAHNPPRMQHDLPRPSLRHNAHIGRTANKLELRHQRRSVPALVLAGAKLEPWRRSSATTRSPFDGEFWREMELHDHLCGYDHLYHSAGGSTQLCYVGCYEGNHGIVRGRAGEYHVGDCKRHLETGASA